MTMTSQTVAKTTLGPFQNQASKMLRQYERRLKKGRRQASNLARLNSIRQAHLAQRKAKRAYGQGIARDNAQGFQKGFSEGEATSRDKAATALWTGYALGFEEGETTGFRSGFDWGFEHGKQQGFHTGTAQGMETGRVLGHQETRNIVAGANYTLVLLVKRWVEMYKLSNERLLGQSAIGGSHGLVSNLPSTTVCTTQESTDFDHGNGPPIDKGIPSSPAPSLINAENTDKISRHTEDATSAEKQSEAVTDPQPEKANLLATVNSMSSNPASSSVEAERLRESSSDTEIIPSIDDHIIAVSEFEPERPVGSVINESQGHSDSEIVSSSSLPLTGSSSPQNAGFLSGPTSFQPLFGPGAVAIIPNDLVPGLGFQTTLKPQTSSVASDATSPLLLGTRLESPAGSSPLVPQSDFAPTLPSSHVTLPGNVTTPQTSLYQIGDAKIAVGGNSAKVFQKAVPRITRSKLAGSCPQPTYIPPVSVLATDDPSKAFQKVDFKPFGQIKTGQAFSWTPAPPPVFVSSVSTQPLSNLPPLGSKVNLLQPGETVPGTSSSSTRHSAAATSSPAAILIASSPTASSVASPTADTSITPGTAHLPDPATSRAALINAKPSTLINPSTKRGGKRVKTPRPHANATKDAKNAPSKVSSGEGSSPSDHGDSE